MDNKLEIAETIELIHESLTKADHAFELNMFEELPDIADDYIKIAKYYVEKAFIECLVLLDGLNLSKTYEQISTIYSQAIKEGFDKQEVGVEDPYLVYSDLLGRYIDAIGAAFGGRSTVSVTKNLIEILKATVYPITDKKLFPNPPANETEVHLRIEGVLRCAFTDLKSKPTLTKPIKNFEPDTGLPSVRTLIEYKYISNNEDAKKVADQILADTRGYVSKDWDRFIYIIYETHRVRPEKEWRLFLSECGIGNNTEVVVLSGEPLVNGPTLE